MQYLANLHIHERFRAWIVYKPPARDLTIR